VLSLRWGLAGGSLFALGALARRTAGHGALGWAAAIAVPLALAAIWSTFAVPGDPCHPRKAPVRVTGGIRIVIELALFFGGAAALVSLDWWDWFDAFIAAFVVHQAGAMKRLQWLSRQK
jgi:hypothetical protein